MRRWRFWLLLLVAALLTPLLATGAARAHGAALQAAITFDPTVPQVNQDVKIMVQLVDAFGADVYGVPVRAGVEKLAALAEASQGTFQGKLRFTAGGKVFVRVEAELPDGVYIADLPVQVGETVVSGLVVDVVHQDSLAGGGAVALKPPTTAPSPAPAPAVQPAPAGVQTPTSGASQTPAPQTPAATAAAKPAGVAAPAAGGGAAPDATGPAGASGIVAPSASPAPAPVTAPTATAQGLAGAAKSTGAAPVVAPATNAEGTGNGWLLPLGLGGLAVAGVAGWLLARRRRGRQTSM